MGVLPFFRVQCDGPCGQWLEILPGDNEFYKTSRVLRASEFCTQSLVRDVMEKAKWIRREGSIRCPDCSRQHPRRRR